MNPSSVNSGGRRALSSNEVNERRTRPSPGEFNTAGSSDAQLWGYGFSEVDEQKQWQEMQQLVNWDIGEEMTTDEEAGGTGDAEGRSVSVSIKDSKNPQSSAAVASIRLVETEAGSSNRRFKGYKDRMYRDRMKSSLQEARALLEARGVNCGVKECELLTAWLRYTMAAGSVNPTQDDNSSHSQTRSNNTAYLTTEPLSYPMTRRQIDWRYRQQFRNVYDEAKAFLSTNGVNCGSNKPQLLRAWLQYTINIEQRGRGQQERGECSQEKI